MSKNAFFRKEEDALAFIREQFGGFWNENDLFGRFFNPWHQGFIMLVDPGTLRPHTQKEALWMIENWLEFPNPRPQYLEEYFFYEKGWYIPRVSFEKLRHKIVKRDLVKRLDAVMCYKYHSCQRQAVLVEITSVVRSCWIDNIDNKKFCRRKIAKK
ncbi:MAG: hypothetical protein CR972_01400 [Candidatus Moraniibacteriota bacterium]|nr:MAG: hypothetical protein CR972_01400 [Candidatus Moranbacteria bacterium]